MTRASVMARAIAIVTEVALGDGDCRTLLVEARAVLRDLALASVDDAPVRDAAGTLSNAQRQARWRAEQRAKRNETVTESVTPAVTVVVTPTVTKSNVTPVTLASRPSSLIPSSSASDASFQGNLAVEKREEEEIRDCERNETVTPSVTARNGKRNGAALRPVVTRDTSAAWSVYAEAYKIRYGEYPLRNATVNAQFKRFTERVPEGEAGLIAVAYVRSQNARYVATGHTVGCLLQDAEKLRTEAVTGRSGTATAARHGDKQAARSDEYSDLFKRLEAEDTARRIADGK